MKTPLKLLRNENDRETILVMASVTAAVILFLTGVIAGSDASFFWIEGAFLMIAAPFVILGAPKKIIATVTCAIGAGLIMLAMSALPDWSPFIILATIVAGAIAHWKSLK